MEFSRELRPYVLSGDVTVTFRLWSRPKVRIGGRYRVGSGQVEIDEIDLVSYGSIDENDLTRSGETDLAALRNRAAHAGPIDEDTLLYRIRFHVVE